MQLVETRHARLSPDLHYGTAVLALDGPNKKENGGGDLSLQKLSRMSVPI